MFLLYVWTCFTAHKHSKGRKFDLYSISSRALLYRQYRRHHVILNTGSNTGNTGSNTGSDTGNTGSRNTGNTGCDTGNTGCDTRKKGRPLV